MPFLPEWAPNVHPMIIHFPIALLFTAAFIDTISMVLKKQGFWLTTAHFLYALGALGTLAAWFSGKQAGDSVFLPTDANALLTEHSDLGHYTLYFFVIFAVLRAVLFVTKLDSRTFIRAGVYVLGLGGLVLLLETADHGAEMVYKYGVGVQAVEHATPTVPVLTDSTGTSAPEPNAEGGWSWKPTKTAAWKTAMTFYSDDDALVTSIRNGGERGDVLGLSMHGDPVMFTFDQVMMTMQLDAVLNLDDFEGTVMLVHHVIDENNYHFTSISNTEMKLGFSERSDLYLFDSEPFKPSGWHAIRVVADQTHFRSYSDQKLVVHGHGDDPGSGFVGMRFNGTGTVLLDFVQTVSLRGERPVDMMDMDH